MDHIEKTTNILRKELESLNSAEMHDLFIFFYKLNHQYDNIVLPEKFEEFLSTFEKNPFKPQEDKEFKKQLIEKLIEYTYDHMSLITAALLIKRKFTVNEIINNYYESMNLFDNNLFN